MASRKMTSLYYNCKNKLLAMNAVNLTFLVNNNLIYSSSARAFDIPVQEHAILTGMCN